jgi:hypothetical protein
MPSELHPSRLKAARDPIDGVWGVLGIHLPVIATDTFSTFSVSFWHRSWTSWKVIVDIEPKPANRKTSSADLYILIVDDEDEARRLCDRTSRGSTATVRRLSSAAELRRVFSSL